MKTALELFTAVEAWPYFKFILPLVLILGGMGIARLFRLPVWLTLILASLPCLLLNFNLPLAEQFQSEHPLAPLLLGWAGVLALGCGYLIARTLKNLFVGRDERSSGVLTLLSAVGVAVVSLLYINPRFLEDVAPGWQGSLGVLLFGLLLLAFVLALFKFLWSGIVILFWAGLCVVVGAEVFMDKLPHEILAKELREMPSFVPRKLLPELPDPRQLIGTNAAPFKILVVGGYASEGEEYPAESRYPGILEAGLNHAQAKPAFKVVDLRQPNFGIRQAEEALEAGLASVKPELVIISGWFVDSQPGENAFGLKGMNDAEAYAQAKWRTSLNYVPFLSTIAESRLLKSAGMLFGRSEEPSLPAEPKPRTSPEEYQATLSRMAAVSKGAGAWPIFFHAPVSSATKVPTEELYRAALESAAEAEELALADMPEAFERKENDLLFLRRDLFSKAGHEVVATTLKQSILALAQKPGLAPPLVTALNQAQSSLTKQISFVTPTKNLNEDLVFGLNFPENDGGFYHVVFSVNGRFVEDRRLSQPERVNVRFALPAEYKQVPAVRVGVRAVRSPLPESARIGRSEFYAPCALKLSQDDGGTELSSACSVRQPKVSAQSGILVATLDARTGEIVTSQTFDLQTQAVEFAKALKAQPWGTVTAVGGVWPEMEVTTPEIGNALRYVGGSGKTKAGDKLFIIGVAGLGAGKASEVSGATAKELAVGTDAPDKNFVFEDLAVGAKTWTGAELIQS